MSPNPDYTQIHGEGHRGPLCCLALLVITVLTAVTVFIYHGAAMLAESALGTVDSTLREVLEFVWVCVCVCACVPFRVCVFKWWWG
jgi:hypothetical protein